MQTSTLWWYGLSNISRKWKLIQRKSKYILIRFWRHLWRTIRLASTNVHKHRSSFDANILFISAFREKLLHKIHISVHKSETGNARKISHLDNLPKSTHHLPPSRWSLDPQDIHCPLPGSLQTRCWWTSGTWYCARLDSPARCGRRPGSLVISCGSRSLRS